MKSRIGDLKLANLYKFNKFIISSILELLTEKELKDWAILNEFAFSPDIEKSALVLELSEEIEQIGIQKRLKYLDEISSRESEIISDVKDRLISQHAFWKPLLTVESGKMSGIFVLYPDNTIKQLDFSLPLITDGWRDHCIVPDNFHRLADELSCGYDNATFAHVCKMFVENYLDSDWTRLHKYLPHGEE